MFPEIQAPTHSLTHPSQPGFREIFAEHLLGPVGLCALGFVVIEMPALLCEGMSYL